MKFMWKAACAAVLAAVTFIDIGCGSTYRPIATPLPVTTGNPATAEMEVVLNTTPGVDSVVTSINVSGDTNAGNKPLGHEVNSIAFDSSRTTVFSTNTAPPTSPLADSVTQVLLNPSTAGFAANTTTISLDPGSAPIGMSFEYFGNTYTQDYVVNSGITPTCPSGGSLGAIVQPTIAQPTAELKATICLATLANPNPRPLFAWIYKDQTKVFVLDNNFADVVSASKYKVTNTIPVGAAPIKATQSADGNYIYVLNHDGASISIINAQAETVDAATGTVSTSPVLCGSLCNSVPIDIAQDASFNDATKNTQVNHVWILHANGTVSVFDGTIPGQLTWITSLPTTATVSATALPTNLALMRDGTQAYVGVNGTDKIVAVDTSKLSQNAISQNATTPITVGVHRSITQSLKDTNGASHSVPVETTTPAVNFVAVSRGGSTADLSKAYATTSTTTIYNCYDSNVNATDCAPFLPANPPTPSSPPTCTNIVGANTMSCANLYNGTAVVTAVGNGATPINTYVTTVPAPSVVTYCDPGNPATGEFDGQKNCPAMTPVLVLGRS